MLRLAAIVGGDGECEAAPILVRRIARTLDPGLVPVVRPVPPLATATVPTTPPEACV